MQHSSQQSFSWQLVSYERSAKLPSDSYTCAKILGENSECSCVAACSLLMSPPGWSGDFQHLQACTQNCGNFYLSKITRLQGSLDTAMSAPLDLPARFLQGLRRLHSFLFSPNTSFTLQPIEQGWDTEESWQQCCVFWLWTTSVSQSYKRVRALWLQGYFHSQPAENDGSPSCSPWWEPILLTSLALHLQHFRILFFWAWLKKF